MKLPVKFPSDAEVIAEEANRFRALASEDRMAVIRGVLDAGTLMLLNSPQSAFLATYAAQQEDAFRRAVQEFVIRHGHRL